MKAAEFAHTSPKEVRQMIREGKWDLPTPGMCKGHVQGNLVILPAASAFDFMRFCQRNPKPCPLLAVSEPGDPALPTLGEDIDIRTDLPRYRVWRDGEFQTADALEELVIDYPGIGPGTVWTCGHPEPITLPATSPRSSSRSAARCRRAA